MIEDVKRLPKAAFVEFFGVVDANETVLNFSESWKSLGEKVPRLNDRLDMILSIPEMVRCHNLEDTINYDIFHYNARYGMVLCARLFGEDFTAACLEWFPLAFVDTSATLMTNLNEALSTDNAATVLRTLFVVYMATKVQLFDTRDHVDTRVVDLYLEAFIAALGYSLEETNLLRIDARVTLFVVRTHDEHEDDEETEPVTRH